MPTLAPGHGRVCPRPCADHRGKRILALTDETTVTVVHLDTGEILSTHHIDPTRSYWRNQLQPPRPMAPQ